MEGDFDIVGGVDIAADVRTFMERIISVWGAN